MIESIYVAMAGGRDPKRVDQVEVVARMGIVGDRYFGKSTAPGQNLTFIDAEEIENFNLTHGCDFDPAAFRRNIVTRGIALNQLVGTTFSVGGCRFYGVELCEPCATLGGSLSTEQLSAADVVKALAHRGGLRADALSSGSLVVGMAFGRIHAGGGCQ